MSLLSYKMLLADACPTTRHLFTDIVARSPLPIELMAVDDAADCRAAFLSGGIDISFVAVDLPGMSGLEPVDAARRSGARTFITLMAPSPSTARQALERADGIYECLIKPLAVSDVEAILETFRRVTHPLRALIVDDSPTIRRVIRKVIDQSQFRIEFIEAPDGGSALELVRSTEFDLVFLDCNMPGLNGLATFDCLMSHAPQVKVIMMSSERNDEQARRARERGAVGFLCKPFYPADIDRALIEAFGLRLPPPAAYTLAARWGEASEKSSETLRRI